MSKRYLNDLDIKSIYMKYNICKRKDIYIGLDLFHFYFEFYIGFAPIFYIMIMFINLRKTFRPFDFDISLIYLYSY